MSKSIERLGLPELRVVAMADVVLHEDFDERRVSAMAHRLQAEGVVKNPPIVAPLGDGRYVVLDGANRVSALRRLGVPDAVVQVVDYADVELSTWYHLVTDASAENMLAAVGQIKQLSLSSMGLEAAREALAAHDILAYLVLPGGAVHGLEGEGDLMRKTELLRRAVAVYKGRANIHRVQTDDISVLESYYAHVGGLFVFPAYRPEDVVLIATRGAKLPSGITRHIIPLRALRTNTELAFLWSDHPRAEKNRWLAEWTRNKVQLRAVRHYAEETVLYDE